MLAFYANSNQLRAAVNNIEEKFGCGKRSYFDVVLFLNPSVAKEKIEVVSTCNMF